MSLRELIEFLTANPFFIIILIGVISSLFKKRNGEPQKHSTPPILKQPVNKEPKLDTTNRPRESRREMSSRNVNTKINNEKKKQNPPLIQFEDYYAKKTEAANNSINELKAEEQKLLQRANQYKALAKERVKNQNEIESKPKLTVEQEEILNGVIWSEILSTSRSKQPYSTRR